MTDAAIHRVSRNADGFVCSLTGSQWIATGYALAMTRCEGEWGMIWAVRLQHTVCHCEEGAEARDAAIHRVSRELGRLLSSLPCSQWIATGFQPSR